MRARMLLSPVVTGNIGDGALIRDNSAHLKHQGNKGRLLAIDLGGKRVGLAVSDELRITVRPVTTIERRSWKDLLRRISKELEASEACGLVIGLPLNIDGSEGPAAAEARRIAAKFGLSLKIPVYLHDERLTTEEAKSRLRAIQRRGQASELDSAAAAVILEDFIAQRTG